jgi:hypothetical protein
MAPKVVSSCVSGERGGLVLRTILSAFVTALVVLILYAGFGLAFQFYDIRNQLVFSLKGADLESDQELRKKIHAYAIRAGIKCEERDILVQRSANKVRVELPFEYRIGLPFGRQDKVSIPVGMWASGERYF